MADLLRLKHILEQKESSVLSLAAHNEYIFSGSQGRDIYVWDKKTLKCKSTLRGHTGSVLALEIARKRNWLFSSSGDSTIRIWCTTELQSLYVVHPYLESDAGDLYCMAYAPSLDTLYVGCQNTSIQWIDFRAPGLNSSSRDQGPRRNHKFFDSLSRYDHERPAGQNDRLQVRTINLESSPTWHIPCTHVVNYAHFGYVYCMAVHPSPHEISDLSHQDNSPVELITGSGDENVKIWACNGSGLTLTSTLESSDGAVLSLITRNGTIYAGCQGGRIKVWDVDTKTQIRTILAHENADIMALSMIGDNLFSSASSGRLQMWSIGSSETVTEWGAHDGIILSSIIVADPLDSQSVLLMTGANDGKIKQWDIPCSTYPSISSDSDLMNTSIDERELLQGLSEFVAIQSVSNAMHREDCRLAAIWLKKYLSQLGANSTVLGSDNDANPLVVATFVGAEARAQHRKRRILFYGHYDVIPAPARGWDSSPFVLSGRNGYLYGRGITDNKGPTLAFAHAAASLLREHTLDIDLVMLIEGEEEAGSKNFPSMVQKYKDLIGDIDAIIVSNSYWIGEDCPCLTYGLRGVLQATIEITSDKPDLHSGVDGGANPEAMVDMIKLLGTLSTGPRVLLPHFYDSVRKTSAAEQELYAMLTQVTGASAKSLASKWREPSLTIHSIEVSGPRNATVIPASIKAQLSLRLVPDQALDDIKTSLVNHLQSSFTELESSHKLRVTINRTADWWLGDIESPWFLALEKAVEDVWHIKPLRIREGGSIPSIPWLEKEFACQALHLPMGQSSDQAHLQNERLSLQNLFNGKTVAERFMLSVATLH